MSAALTVKDKSDNLKKLLDSRLESISRALPKHFMPAARMAQIVLAVCGRNPKLLDANHASLLGSVMQCAALGLDPEPALGQAWFVPYKGIVQFQVGYKGYATLAWRSGMVSHLSMQVVRVGDMFDYEYGSQPFLRHKPTAPIASAVEAAYATAKPIGGDVMFEVLTREMVEAVRKRSPARDSGPWVTDWDAMARKTAFKRTAKLLPLSSEKAQPLAKAMDFDTRSELGMQQHLDGEIQEAIGDLPAEQQEEEVQK